MEQTNMILESTFIFIVIYIIQVAINLAVWIFIIKTIYNIIKRSVNRKFFKNNVIINKKLDSNNNFKSYKKTYNDVTKKELAKFNTDDIESLKECFYNMFIEFEQSYNNLDYNVMKMLCTKQLYQNYYTGITLDLKVGKKRIITDIEKKDIKIFELDSTIAKQVASVMIEICYINYTIDKNGYVISGSRDHKITEKFEVVFRKDFKKEDVIKCPSCGAAVLGNKCEYCRSIIKNEVFKISSIKKIIEE